MRRIKTEDWLREDKKESATCIAVSVLLMALAGTILCGAVIHLLFLTFGGQP